MSLHTSEQCNFLLYSYHSASYICGVLAPRHLVALWPCTHFIRPSASRIFFLGPCQMEKTKTIITAWVLQSPFLSHIQLDFSIHAVTVLVDRALTVHILDKQKHEVPKSWTISSNCVHKTVNHTHSHLKFPYKQIHLSPFRVPYKLEKQTFPFCRAMRLRKHSENRNPSYRDLADQVLNPDLLKDPK